MAEWIRDPRTGPVCCERCGVVLWLQSDTAGNKALVEYMADMIHTFERCTELRACFGGWPRPHPMDDMERLVNGWHKDYT